MLLPVSARFCCNKPDIHRRTLAMLTTFPQTRLDTDKSSLIRTPYIPYISIKKTHLSSFNILLSEDVMWGEMTSSSLSFINNQLRREATPYGIDRSFAGQVWTAIYLFDKQNISLSLNAMWTRINLHRRVLVCSLRQGLTKYVFPTFGCWRDNEMQFLLVGMAFSILSYAVGIFNIPCLHVPDIWGKWVVPFTAASMNTHLMYYGHRCSVWSHGHVDPIYLKQTDRCLWYKVK